MAADTDGCVRRQTLRVRAGTWSSAAGGTRGRSSARPQAALRQRARQL